MKRPVKVIVCMLTALFIICAMPAGAQTPWDMDGEAIPAGARENASLSLTCRAAILIEPQTGTVIYEHNADERLPEASITKVMTLLLVMEAIDSGRIAWEDVVTCSAHAASMGGSQIWLEEGEQMTVRELVKATAVSSANDASVVLAEHIAGSHESFVALMNDRARELGLTKTAYRNCTGLDAEGHLTSARDVAFVSAELMRHKEIFEFSTIWQDSLRGGELSMTNTNKLIRSYDGANGLKTGTTSQAGCCVAASAEREGMTLIAVVMGAPNSKSRFADARKLLDHGFANYSLLSLDSLSVETPVIPVLKGMEKEVETCVDLTGSVLVPKGRAGDVQITVEAAPDVLAPVVVGQTVGAVTLTLDGTAIGRYDILTAGATDEVTFENVIAFMFAGLIG